MKILIINGPNLNLLGKRETNIYGNQNFDDFLLSLKNEYHQVSLDYFQSNHEGLLIDKIQEANGLYDAVILNAGAFTHTSVAVADAIAAINTPVMEVHISNIYKREEFRKKSFLTANCIGIIAGLGLSGYALAIQYFLRNNK
jgi:3-dehydroquinate dehydratase-2